MPFTDLPNTFGSNVPPLGAGEVIEAKVHNIDSFNDYTAGIEVGTFVKYDTGNIAPLDNSATPTIAGVSQRFLTGDMTKSTFTNEDQINVINYGYATVRVVTGDTPAKYGQVYAVNAPASTDWGFATTTSTDNVAVANCDFWENLGNDVWIVRMKEIL